MNYLSKIKALIYAINILLEDTNKDFSVIIGFNSFIITITENNTNIYFREIETLSEVHFELKGMILHPENYNLK